MIDYEHFKAKLESEKHLLEKEMSEIGRKNPDQKGDWEPLPTNRDVSGADENLAADAIEEYEDNAAIMETLEVRYNDIKSGLDKIKHGTYGVCQVCGEEIEIERLEANPSARTCMKHIDQA